MTDRHGFSIVFTECLCELYTYKGMKYKNVTASNDLTCHQQRDTKLVPEGDGTGQD